MTTALLFALVLAGRLLFACQEQSANPVTDTNALDSKAVNPNTTDSNTTDPKAFGLRRSHSHRSDTKSPGSRLLAPKVVNSKTVNSKAADPKAVNSKPVDPKAGDPNKSGLRSPRNKTSSRGSAAVPARQSQSKLPPAALRFLRTSSDTASLLRSESRAAFERGLLPLADYSDQLALALKMELAAADVRGSEAGRSEALAAHAQQLQAAAGLLQQFNQPAARGWQADLAQADFLAAEAAVLATTNPQNAASRAQARQLVSDRARNQYALRLADFESGLATLSDLSHAASLMAGDLSEPEIADAAIPGLIDYQARMQQILINTENLAQRGADGGRIDHIHQAQFELSRSSLLLAGLSKNEPTASTAFQTADQAGRELLASEARLYDSGTATLFDLAQSWSQWQELHRQAKHFEIEIPEASSRQQQSGLQRLTELADRQTDLRGRIAADVTMVHSLKILTDLRQLAEDADTSSSQSSP